jgi:hypothetical protein
MSNRTSLFVLDKTGLQSRTTARTTATDDTLQQQ